MSENENKENTLVVVSKLKSYVREKAGMNTSASVVPILSDLVRKWCDTAIENAKNDGRKTVMDRDFPSNPSL
ncbi:MAG: hypothetical protein GYA55_01860 [SAR324 cluster bacterium]|uniref:Transcription factor CBF/NF-Y/archaeal histone domain-containing protein n=1 Tax=SAR324 cluster bacterium TaxID=2024889 RepID=A0A7X9FPL7_9DELT|nr:hypothetical protein [SAR324 cluster bacterium]